MFLKNKRSEGGAVGVVLIQFSKRFRPVAENGNKERHLWSPLESSSQLQKNVIVVVGWLWVQIPVRGWKKYFFHFFCFSLFFSWNFHFTNMIQKWL
jgi:hypothetical protein